MRALKSKLSSDETRKNVRKISVLMSLILPELGQNSFLIKKSLNSGLSPVSQWRYFTYAPFKESRIQASFSPFGLNNKKPQKLKKLSHVDKRLPCKTQGFNSFSQSVSFSPSILDFFNALCIILQADFESWGRV